MISTILITQEERSEKINLISEIAEAIYGTEEASHFSESFIPPAGRVPNPKSQNFKNYLLRGPRLLWAIKFNDETIGFILISDMPYKNALGFGINLRYAKMGICSSAFDQIKNDVKISYPLFAYTSANNIAAHHLLTKLNFTRDPEHLNFLGELSYKYTKK